MRFPRIARRTTDRPAPVRTSADRSGRARSIARFSIAVAGFSLLAATFSPAASATASGALACTSPTFSVYPGSSISNLRYGQVDFNFYACSDQAPSSWSASVTKAQVNSTGKNLGFYIDGTSIPTDSTGSYYRYFRGNIFASTCTPRVHFPCARSYSFSVQFQVTKDRFGNPQVYMGSKTAPAGMALFTTP
ncbi:hypothetical protein [Streptosporangium sp. 'caverna']|uniref:hypothetical protein n=1 Tax=Streptosporangium sp. 'caverna' TaxID=2202249 RepID=UPI0013A6EC39|nr:hypothetical protein [Streptosporangium sp. 'caverna']